MKELKENQRIAAKLLAAGYKQVKIAKMLDVTQDTIQNWLKLPLFRKEFDFWRNEAETIFEESLRNSLAVVSDKLLDIVVDGKDTDALGAIEKILRVLGKYDDRITVLDKKEDIVDRVTRLLTKTETTLGIKSITKNKGDTITDIIVAKEKQPRELAEDTSS